MVFAVYMILLALNVANGILILKINKRKQPTFLATAACFINVVSIGGMYFLYVSAS